MCCYNNIGLEPIRWVGRKVFKIGADPELREPIVNQQADDA